MEEEAGKLLQEIKKIEAKETALKAAREEASKKLNALRAGAEMSPNEIATMKSEIKDLNSEAEGYILRDCEING